MRRALVLLLFPFLLSSGTSAAVWQFSHEIVDPAPLAGDRMVDMRIADINADGLPAIWTSGEGGGNGAYQMVWYKNPTWERYTIAPGEFKYGELADLNEDGTLDIVVGGENGTSVHWYENTGSPQQADWPAHDTGIPDSPDVIYVGDIDGDGSPDIVYMYKDAMGWAWSSVDPTLPWSRREIWSGERRTGGRIADIDLDGDIDILYGNAWFENPRPAGDPKTDSWNMQMVDTGWDVEARGDVGHLNDDGRPDIVLSDEEGSHGVAWYEGPSDPHGGTWIKHVVHPSYEGVHSLQLADFNNDGRLDIFAAEMHNRGQARVTVFECVHIETNTWEERIVDTMGSHNAQVADIDGDGWTDIVGKNFEAGPLPIRVDLWRNRIDAPFTLSEWERHLVDTDALFNALFVVARDLDGDGLPDIASGDSWYRNPGTLSAPWPKNPVHPLFKNVLAAWDIDADGLADLFGTRSVLGTDFLWARNEGASFTLQDNIPEPAADYIQGLRVAQILPGQNPEVILSYHDASATAMLIIPDPATEPWALEDLSPTANGEQIAVQDLDGDGDPDIHLGTAWLRREVSGAWTAFEAVALGDPEAKPDRVEVADVDGDGDWDVLIGCESANRLVWGECPADPTAPWPEHVIATDLEYMSLDVGDLDRDGDPDIVAGGHNSDGRAFLFQNSSNGAFWTPYVLDGGLPGLDHHDGTRLVDLDLDGDFDVISVGWTNRTVLVYENKAVQAGPPGEDSTPPTAPDSLRSTYVSDSEIRLEWIPAIDPESGVSHYKVYRDGSHKADTEETTLADTGLSELTLYAYAVSAVNGAGLEGPMSPPLWVVTGPDVRPPTIVEARADWGPTEVRVLFSEPLEKESAEDPDNYDIDRGISVSAAVLDTAEMTVILTASHLSTDTLYTLTVNGVRDQASDPNTIHPDSQTTFTYQSQPNSDGLLAHWTLDDGNGNVAFDSSGNGNHGTVNGATWTDGLMNGALHFDGVNHHIDLGPLDPPSDNRSAFSILAWFNAESFNSHRDNRIVSKTTSSSEEDHYWMLSPLKQANRTLLRFRLKIDGTTETLVAQEGDIQTGQWVLAVGTYDGSNMRLFMDNDEVGVLPKNGEVSANGSVVAMIGMNSDGSDAWHGIVDDVRLYHRALTPLEVDSLYRQGIDDYPTGPGPGADSQAFDDVRIVSPIGADEILYYLPDPSDVLIRLYDVHGRRLLSRDLGRRPSGWNTYLHQGMGDKGIRLPSGTYFIRLSALGTEKTAKLILLRD
jgi:hypothetical protein